MQSLKLFQTNQNKLSKKAKTKHPMPLPTVAQYDSMEHQRMLDGLDKLVPDDVVDTVRSIEELLQLEVGDDFGIGLRFGLGAHVVVDGDDAIRRRR